MDRLLTKIAETRQRLSSSLQRRLKAQEENALSQKEGFFSSELLLSASVLFLPVVYMTAALALLSRLGLGLWVFPTGLLLWGTAVATLHREEGWQKLAATLSLFLAAFALAAFLASLTLDGGSDSRAYHARAIAVVRRTMSMGRQKARSRSSYRGCAIVWRARTRRSVFRRSSPGSWKRR